MRADPDAGPRSYVVASRPLGGSLDVRVSTLKHPAGRRATSTPPEVAVTPSAPPNSDLLLPLPISSLAALCPGLNLGGYPKAFRFDAGSTRPA